MGYNYVAFRLLCFDNLNDFEKYNTLGVTSPDSIL